MSAADSTPDDLCAAALAALTDADIPPDDLDRAAWTDPDTGRPVELEALTDAELADLLAETPVAEPPPGWPLTYETPAGSLRSSGENAGSAEAEGGGADASPELLWPAGFEPREGAVTGSGFASGGVLDNLAAGLLLAEFADEAARQAGQLDDDRLIGVLRAWRRLTSWAQARELEMITELVRRRPADGYPSGDPGGLPSRLSEFIGAEVGAALTLTGMAAGRQVELALELHRRPATAAGLHTGEIDLAKAKILTEMLAPLAPDHADAVEAEVLPVAPGMTTGQLRAALARAILAIDPEAARRRREEAEQGARVEHYPAPDGTGTLAGRNLPLAPALAASKRLTQIAHAWKKQGARGGMDLLRAHVYLALLNGLDTATPPASLLSATAGEPVPADAASLGAGPGAGHVRGRQDGSADRAGAQLAPARAAGHGDLSRGDCADAEMLPGQREVPAGLCRSGSGGLDELRPTAGLINLTVPLTTLLGIADNPGAAAGYGPLDADTSRLLACALAGHRATRWQITVTGPDGTALATGIHRGPARGSPATRGQPATGSPQASDRPGQPGEPDRPGHAGDPDRPRGPGRPAEPADGASRPSGFPGGTGGGWTVQVTAEPIAGVSCDHRTAERGYRASPALQRLIRTRTTTCTGPGCRRPAARCDLDHTRAYDDGGITCECNEAPLCRFCHRLKQAQHWQLHQPAPGVMIWITPAGRRYVTLPSRYPT